MKANELMIDDWVDYNPNVLVENEYEQAKPIKTVRIERGEDLDWADEGCYEPIPLTEEILKANGFELIESGGRNRLYVLHDKGYVAKVYIFPTNCVFDIENNIKIGDSYGVNSVHKIGFYVHELQHALRLCELNELADNFKLTTA